MTPSPYVTIYISRKQAEAVLAAVAWMADGKGKSHPLHRAFVVIEKALAENNR